MIKKLLQIFKPGKHVAADGKTYEFTEADLKASAAAYNPTLHKAPLVIGHPKHDAPAYGWVNALSFNDSHLEADREDVDPEFAEIVNKGYYRTMSASFYSPDSPHNPVPGVYYLRHVGFLGAQAPALKGLATPSFADGEDFIEFSDSVPSRWYFSSVGRLFRRLRDHMIDTVGLDQADKVLNDYEVKEIETVAERMMPAAEINNFSDDEESDEMSAAEKARLALLETENARLIQENISFAESTAAREAELAAQVSASRRASVVTLVDTLITEGKVLPKDKNGLVEFMASLGSDVEIEFAEGDAQVKKSGGDFLREFLTGLKPQIDFSERTADTGRDAVVLDVKSADAIANKALEFVEAENKAGRTISIASAVHHVTQQAAQANG